MQNWLNVVFLKPFLARGPPSELDLFAWLPPTLDAVTYEKKVFISTLFICILEYIYVTFNA